MQLLIKKIFIIFCFLFLINNTSYALDKIPLSQTQLRLVPVNVDSIDGLGPKSITLIKNSGGYMIRWFSQTRHKTQEEPWPEFQVSMKRGALQTESILTTDSISHPHLWSDGFFNLSNNSLLWGTPEMISSKKRNAVYKLEPGFLDSSFEHFGKGPKELVETVTEFKNFADAFKLVESQSSFKNTFSSKERTDLLEFFQNYPFVKVVTKNKMIEIYIDGAKQKLDVIVVGNAYYTYTILKDAANPLILRLDFSSKEVPKRLKKIFSFFEEFLEFQITQIKTQVD